jgi:hypothetical protein
MKNELKNLLKVWSWQRCFTKWCFKTL